jgi:hypothetical protein
VKGWFLKKPFCHSSQTDSSDLCNIFSKDIFQGEGGLMKIVDSNLDFAISSHNVRFRSRVPWVLPSESFSSTTSVSPSCSWSVQVFRFPHYSLLIDWEEGSSLHWRIPPWMTGSFSVLKLFHRLLSVPFPTSSGEL